MTEQNIIDKIHEFLLTHHENVECNTCINVFEDLRSLIEEIEAGRQSVVENISELEWKECVCNNDEYFASCPVGIYKVSRWHDLFEVWCNAYFICYRPSLSEAKQVANDDYKNRIKQALGL